MTKKGISRMPKGDGEEVAVMTTPSMREWEALAEEARCQEDGTAALMASRLLERATAFRSTAREARPVVVEWLNRWYSHELAGPPESILDALLIVLQYAGLSGYKGPHERAALLAAYDRFCDATPSPDNEPYEVEPLIDALARWAVRRMMEQK